jgi:hypothetical protein
LTALRCNSHGRSRPLGSSRLTVRPSRPGVPASEPASRT